MAKGPQGQKRPGDVIGAAIKVAKIATGEEEETFQEEGKDEAAQTLGRKGGRARAAKLTKKQRIEIAKKASRKRWGLKK
ncbi:MAG: hypothetical protein MRJ96_08500 [Nitrospirales bacterium]|nr:hypothetical protein [Nitrospira sp.]MDR4501473.1 hypothetical protein [Nitrospirales bacterium]